MQWCTAPSDSADVHLSNETTTSDLSLYHDAIGSPMPIEQPSFLSDRSTELTQNFSPDPEPITRLKTSENPMILDQVPSVEPSSTHSKERDDLWSISNIEEHFDELYQSYVTNLNQYENLKQHMHGFAPIQQTLTPISEESLTLFEQIQNLQQDEQSARNDRPSPSSLLTIQRQANHIGHYGFELEQDVKDIVRISSIIDPHYCPNLAVGDEVLSINQRRSLRTLEEYHSLFHFLWHQPCEYVQISVRKLPPPPPHIPSKALNCRVCVCV